MPAYEIDGVRPVVHPSAYAFVGAHAFVKSGFVVPPRMLATGSPATVVRPLSDAELAWKANGTVTYQDLARRSLATLREVTPLTEIEPDRPALPIRSSGDS